MKRCEYNDEENCPNTLNRRVFLSTITEHIKYLVNGVISKVVASPSDIVKYHSKEIRVQILDDTDCISHSTNTLGKGMNPIILPPAMGK